MSKAFEAALACVAVPWRQREGTALVEAYSPALGGWAVVAEGRNTAELTARDVAALIVNAVNGDKENETALEESIAALKLCLECDGLSWEAEHDAEIALRRAGAFKEGGREPKKA